MKRIAQNIWLLIAATCITSMMSAAVVPVGGLESFAESSELVEFEDAEALNRERRIVPQDQSFIRTVGGGSSFSPKLAKATVVLSERERLNGYGGHLRT
jgi:hypothetical protein